MAESPKPSKWDSVPVLDSFFRLRGSAEKMQIVRNATLLAALAMTSVSMLIDTAWAVEVSDLTTPLLPTAQNATQPERGPLPQATPPSPDCFILGARSFTIPFTVDAGGTQPIEVRLFGSRGDSSGAPDQWQLLDRKRPDIAVKEFQFIANEDGEFWFATRTIDAQGRSHPNGTIEPQLKVFVDTTKPFVTFNAEADASGALTRPCGSAMPRPSRTFSCVT